MIQKTDQWEKKIDECEFIGIQLSNKIVHEKDQVERDEGIWLYSDPDTKIDEKPFFKDLPLKTRIELVERAKKKTIRKIKEHLSQAQQTEKTGENILAEDLQEFDRILTQIRSIEGNAFPEQVIEHDEWLKYSKNSRISICTLWLKGIEWRYNEALRLLNNLSYITENHDFK